MWKYGFASVAGTAHLKSSVPLQDFSLAEVMHDSRGNEIFVAIVSDGAGSAANSQAGAKLACETLVRDLKSHFAGGGTLNHLTKDFIGEWVDKFQFLINGFADDAEMKAQDFACTLLASVVGQDRAAYFQIGDGAIIESVSSEKDLYRCVCWPQQGEYANTTNFLTDTDAKEKIFCELKPAIVNEVALFTDGIQSLVLDYRTQSAHSPFFASLFAWLRPRLTGYSHELSESLIQYLNSDKVNARTDDDKTLILATRNKP